MCVIMCNIIIINGNIMCIIINDNNNEKCIVMKMK